MDRKGFVEQYIAVVVLAIIVSVIFALANLYYLQKKSSATEIVMQRYIKNVAYSGLIKVFYGEIPDVKKSVIELIADGLTQKSNCVRYGAGVGEVNITQVIPQILNGYFGKNNWYVFATINRSGQICNITLGNKNCLKSKETEVMTTQFPYCCQEGELLICVIREASQR